MTRRIIIPIINTLVFIAVAVALVECARRTR